MSFVDPGAPIHVRAELAVDASPDDVWSLLADIEGWPDWNPGIREARSDGELAVGTTFRWAAGPGRITSRLTAVDRPGLLAWSGRSMSIRATHAWHIEPRDGGSTVTAEESLHGPLARLLAGRLRRGVQASLESWLQLLKLEVEHAAGT